MNSPANSTAMPDAARPGLVTWHDLDELLTKLNSTEDRVSCVVMLAESQRGMGPVATLACDINENLADISERLEGLAELINVTHADPILPAIETYRRGMADFNTNCPSGTKEAEAYIEQSYGPPMAVLEAWTAPCATVAGAVEAIRMAHDEIEEMGSGVGPDLSLSMLKAALAFFDGGKGGDA